MGYEILIRNRPDQPLSEEALVTRLAALAAAGIPEPTIEAPPTAEPAAPQPAAPQPAAANPGTGPWVAANLKGRVEIRLSRTEGALRGADFDIPFGGSEDELRRAFACACQVAAEFGAIVFDPQVGRELGKAGVDEAVARWRTSQDWMVGVAGDYDERRAELVIPEPTPIINRTNKIILIIVGIFLLVLWLIGQITDLVGPTP